MYSLGLIADPANLQTYQSAELLSMENFGNGFIILGAVVGVLALAYFLKNKMK